MNIDNFEVQYKNIIHNILTKGKPIEASKGSMRVIPFAEIRLQPEVVPLITARKMYPSGIIGELKAFLGNAKTNEDFVKEGCNFWGAWADKPIDYVRLLHDFNGVNQLENVILNLKQHPHSRKHIISLWDPSSDTLQPPCVMHYQWQVIDKTLHMTWSQRSVDTVIGLPSDMLSAWLFNQVIAREVGYKAGEVRMQLSAVHVYDVHDLKLLMQRRVLRHETKMAINFHDIYHWDVEFYNYVHNDPIKFDLCV